MIPKKVATRADRKRQRELINRLFPTLPEPPTSSPPTPTEEEKKVMKERKKALRQKQQELIERLYPPKKSVPESPRINTVVLEKKQSKEESQVEQVEDDTPTRPSWLTPVPSLPALSTINVCAPNPLLDLPAGLEACSTNFLRVYSTILKIIFWVLSDSSFRNSISKASSPKIKDLQSIWRNIKAV